MEDGPVEDGLDVAAWRQGNQGESVRLTQGTGSADGRERAVKDRQTESRP